VPITLEFIVDGNSQASISVNLDATGHFSTDARLAPGDYVVRAKGSHWLTKSLGTVAISRNTTGLDFVLINGDVNDDDQVDIGDFALLSSAFGSHAGDTWFLRGADLNGDQRVDGDDYAILADNFGRVGDP
jgi:hypothetical protein